MSELSPPSASVTRVRVRKRFDADSADRYRHRISSALKSGRAVVIHFPAGTFVDAQGLWTLVGLGDLGRDLQQVESMAVASGSREVTQLIDMTRLDRYLPVFKNPDAAATWLQARRCGDENMSTPSSHEPSERFAG